MADLLKVSLIGSLPSGEVWSVNPVFRIGPPGDIITSAEGAALVAGISNVTIPTSLRAFQSASTSHTAVRVEARFLDGRLEGVYEAARSTVANGTGTQQHPFQVAAVTSLRTSTPGPSGRGRLFWPATAANLSSTTLRLPSTDAGTFLTAVRTYMTGIDSAIETVLGPVNAQLCVWSRKNASTATVNRIQIGDVLDVQRRRRDSLFETITELGYPT